MITLKTIKMFCQTAQDCKLKQVFRQNRAAVIPLNNKNLSCDTIEISENALKNKLLQVRDNYIAQNPEAFNTLDHIKSNYDNSWIIKSVENQTKALDAVSTDDFCNLSEIMKGVRLPEDVEVYRAMEAGDFNIGRLTPDEFFKQYFKEGKVVTVPIYMSTSLDKNIAYRFAKNNPYRFIINLKVPKGHPAVYMEKLAPGDALHYRNEEEINIIKNSLVKFDKVSKKINPLNSQQIYEIDGTVIGFKDIPPPPPKEFVMDDEMQELLKAIMNKT